MHQLFTIMAIFQLCNAQERPNGQLEVEIGTTVCVNGFVMDYTCIKHGRLFDNPSIDPLGPNGPIAHSIHCLIDVPICANSPFEILHDVSNGRGERFGRAWRVASNDLIIKHAKKVGVCDNNCKGRQESGLTVTAIGKVLNLGNSNTPALIEVEQVGHGKIGCGKYNFEVPNMIF